jgi:hypothetical protein
MTYHFPPVPPEYSRVIGARVACLALALAALAWLVIRVRWRRSVRERDIIGWWAIAVAGGFLGQLGMTDSPGGDDNVWVMPLMTAVFSFSVAGTTLSFIKLYEEQRFGMIAAVTIGLGLFWGWYLLPPLGHPREASYRTQCKNNLKQIGLALHNYHDTNSAFPPSTAGDPPHSWRVAILPYLEQQSVFTSYDFASAWNVEPNAKFALHEVRAYICPSSTYPKDSQGRWFTAYSMPTGPHTVGESSTGTPLKDISDGTSNTLLVVEACGSQILWTEPRDVDAGVQPTGINLDGVKRGQSAGWISGYHRNGAHVLLADGTVRFLAAKTDPAVLKKLATMDDGGEVGDY